MFDAADRYLGRYKFWPAVRLLMNRFCVSLLNRFKYVSATVSFADSAGSEV